MTAAPLTPCFTAANMPLKSVAVESGGGSRLQPEEANMNTAPTGMCRSLGIVEGTPLVGKDVIWPGETVREDDPKGEVLDVFGHLAR